MHTHRRQVRFCRGLKFVAVGRPSYEKEYKTANTKSGTKVNIFRMYIEGTLKLKVVSLYSKSVSNAYFMPGTV